MFLRSLIAGLFKYLLIFHGLQPAADTCFSNKAKFTDSYQMKLQPSYICVWVDLSQNPWERREKSEHQDFGTRWAKDLIGTGNFARREEHLFLFCCGCGIELFRCKGSKGIAKPEFFLRHELLWRKTSQHFACGQKHPSMHLAIGQKMSSGWSPGTLAPWYSSETT